jgi:hypothetical protein
MLWLIIDEGALINLMLRSYKPAQNQVGGLTPFYMGLMTNV